MRSDNNNHVLTEIHMRIIDMFEGNQKIILGKSHESSHNNALSEQRYHVGDQPA